MEENNNKLSVSEKVTNEQWFIQKIKNFKSFVNSAI